MSHFILFNHLCGFSLDSPQIPHVPKRLWNQKFSNNLSLFYLLLCGGNCGFGFYYNLDCRQLKGKHVSLLKKHLFAYNNFLQNWIYHGCLLICFIFCLVLFTVVVSLSLRREEPTFGLCIIYIYWDTPNIFLV